jgi:hypothetical protein
MARRLDDLRLAVLMLDGIELKGRTNIVALGISTEGVKIPLGLWEGSTWALAGSATRRAKASSTRRRTGGSSRARSRSARGVTRAP